MKLLLSSLLLSSLCALSSWSVSSGTLVVTQSPDVSVMEGDTVNITCCWTGHLSKGRINWLKNQTEIKNESLSLKSQSVENQSNYCLNLSFSNVRRENAGRYICRVTVEIPVFKAINGTGTIITVSPTEKINGSNTGHNTTGGGTQDSNKSSSTSVMAAVAAVVPLFIITLICFCILRRKQAQAARVIYEVPHIDSEVADMDKHSTSSSRGSSQWCQVPVYESCDYFEHMPTKESE